MALTGQMGRGWEGGPAHRRLSGSGAQLVGNGEGTARNWVGKGEGAGPIRAGG